MPWIIGAAAIGGSLIAANSASDAADTQAAATGKAVDATNQQYGQTRSDLAPYRNAGNAALARLNALIGIGPQPTTGGTGVPTDPAATAWRQSQIKLLPQGFMDTNADGSQFLNTTGEDPASATTGGTPELGADGQPVYGSLLRDFGPTDLANDPIYKNALDFTTQQGERAINSRRAASGTWDSGAALKELGTFNLGNASTLAGDAYTRFNTNRANKASLLSGLTGTGLSAAGATSSAGTANASNLANLYTGQGNAAAAAGIAGGNAINGGISTAVNNYNSNNLLAQLSGGGQRRLDDLAPPLSR